MSEIRQLLNDELLKVEPPAVVQQAPSPPMPAEDRQAVDQVFSQKDEDDESMAAMLLAWQMMPMVQERHLKKVEEEEEADGEKPEKPRQES